MQIQGSVALVTGANRGLGKAFVEALLARGATKVYAGTRRPLSSGDDPRLVPVQLDVTSAADISAVAALCPDVTLLINNAGILLARSALQDGSDAALRQEMEVNVYGLLSMTRAFAPLLGKNGGGAIVNMLSVVSWFTTPLTATYCASKHAALSVSDSSRVELRRQKTQVVGVYAGYIDTDMAASIGQPKTPPRQIADRALDAVEKRQNHVHADARAEEVWRQTRENPEQLEKLQQLAWETRPR